MIVKYNYEISNVDISFSSFSEVFLLNGTREKYRDSCNVFYIPTLNTKGEIISSFEDFILFKERVFDIITEIKKMNANIVYVSNKIIDDLESSLYKKDCTEFLKKNLEILKNKKVIYKTNINDEVKYFKSFISLKSSIYAYINSIFDVAYKIIFIKESNTIKCVVIDIEENIELITIMIEKIYAE